MRASEDVRRGGVSSGGAVTPAHGAPWLRELRCSSPEPETLYRAAFGKECIPGGEAAFAAWIFDALDGRWPLVGDRVALPSHDEVMAAGARASPAALSAVRAAVVSTDPRRARLREAGRREGVDPRAAARALPAPKGRGTRARGAGTHRDERGAARAKHASAPSRCAPAAAPAHELARVLEWASPEALSALGARARAAKVPWSTLERVAAACPGGAADRFAAMQVYALLRHAITQGHVRPETAAALERHVLPALESGRLRVETPAGATSAQPVDGSAAYFLEANTLRLGACPVDLDDLPQAAVIVHEAQHVVQDGERQRGSLLDFERDAYTVAADYLLRASGAVGSQAGDTRVDAGRLQGLLTRSPDPVELERLVSIFGALAAANLRAGHPELNGPELDEQSTPEALDAVVRRIVAHPVPRSFDTAYTKLMLQQGRRRGEPVSWEDMVAKLGQAYDKDGLDAPARAAPAAAPETPSRGPASREGLLRLHAMTVQVHGIDLALECDLGRVTRHDVEVLVRALGRFPPTWLAAAAARGARDGRGLPRLVLCDSAAFAALRPIGHFEPGWYDAAENRVVVDIQRFHGGAAERPFAVTFADAFTATPTGRANPGTATELLEHTIIHELAHAFDHLAGGSGGEVATDQGRKRSGGGAFAQAVRARNASLDPADYVSRHDRRRNMGLDDATAEPEELFAEIVRVLVTEGAAGRDRLRSRPSLRPLVDGIDLFLSRGLRPALLAGAPPSNVPVNVAANASVTANGHPPPILDSRPALP